MQAVEVEAAVLQTGWDGTVIVFSDQPISSAIRPYCIATFVCKHCVLPLTLSVLMGIVLFRTTRTVGRYHAICQRLGICAIALLSTISWLLFSPLSFANNPTARTLSIAKHSKEFGHVSTINDKARFLDLIANNCLTIDARLPEAFGASHVKQAINLPVNSGFLRLADFASKYDHALPVVVYCNDEKCEWAKSVAMVISALGFTDVSVFVPGFAGLMKNSEEESMRNEN